MTKYIFFTLFCMVSIALTATNALSEQTSIEQLLAITEELFQETLNPTFQLDHEHEPEQRGHYRQSVEEIVANKLTPIQDDELLGSLAVLAWTIGFPDEGGFDELFWQTFYRCLTKIAERPSQENYQILNRIDCHLCLDGADSVMFREIMVRHFGEFSGMTEASLQMDTPAQPHYHDKKKSRKMSKETTEELIKRINAKMQASIEKGELQFVDANAPCPDISAISPKQERIRELLTLIKDLYQYALQTPARDASTSAIRDAIRQELADVHEPKQLSRVASMAWVLSSFGDISDVQSGTIFYQTYRISIEKLAANPSPETHSALSLIHRCGLCLEGEEEEFFQEHFKSVIQHLKETGQW